MLWEAIGFTHEERRGWEGGGFSPPYSVSYNMAHPKGVGRRPLGSGHRGEHYLLGTGACPPTPFRQILALRFGIGNYTVVVSVVLPNHFCVKI